MNKNIMSILVDELETSVIGGWRFDVCCLVEYRNANHNTEHNNDNSLRSQI